MDPHPYNKAFTWRDARPPFRIISAEQANQWNASGYFLLKDALDKAALAAMTDVIDPLEARTNDFLRTRKDGRHFIARADEITFSVHIASQHAVARQFARHPVFTSLCLDLLGPDCRLYWDQAVYKKPHCKDEFPWHQDNGYNFVEPQDYLTCWVPLTDATVDNGCPWVVPGINREGTLAHWQTELGWQCIDGMADAVPVEAAAGDVVVFSSLTPHRTGPNHTDQERKAYILQYCHDGACMLSREDGTATCQDDPDRQFLVVEKGVPV